MKRNLRTILHSAILALCSLSAYSQGLQGIIVEDYYTLSAADATFLTGLGNFDPPVGTKVYRIYVDMAPNYKLNTISGSPVPIGGGVSPNPLNFSTTTAFWNNIAAGTELPPTTSSMDAGTAFDSYITINRSGASGGVAGCGSNTQQLGVLKTADANGNLTYCTVYSGWPTSGAAGNPEGNTPGTATNLTYNLGNNQNGSVFTLAALTGVDVALNPVSLNQFQVIGDSWATLPNGTGVDGAGTNRVLIAQFTTTGILSFHINVQLQAAGGALETYVWQTAGAGEVVSSMLTYPQASVVTVGAHLFLEGPFVSGPDLMNDALRGLGTFPSTDPYPALGYVHTGGGNGGSVAPSVLAVTGNNAIVDWALLELRNPSTPSTVVASRSVLVQRDGDVVDLDGTSNVTFGVAPGNYYVAARHRNHLGVMTGSALALSAASTPVDFSVLSTATYGTNATKTTGTKQVLWAGDVTFNGVAQYTGLNNDRDPILVTVGSTTPNNVVNNTYSTRDVNMDATVKYTGSANDRDPILVNIGSTTPNNVRNAQLP